MNSAQADIEGTRLHWRERGAGAPVVLLHAFPLSSALWLPQFESLPPNRHWIAPDMRGFGLSEAGGPLSMDRMADDVAALLDHLGHASATLCGVSMGGYVAFAFLRRHARRVAALVLCDTRATADDPAGKLSRRISAERVRADGTPAIVTQMLDRLVGETTKRRRPGVYARVRNMLEDARPASFVRAQAAMSSRPDSTPLLGRIAVPTLVVTGSEDVIIKPDDARALARAIPGARLEVIEEAGHLPSLEQPERFNQSLLDFLGTSVVPIS
jgi:pimeloyl-ACP methyl ester carboxylesterase